MKHAYIITSIHERLQEAGEVGDNARLKGFHSVDDDNEKVRMLFPWTFMHDLTPLLKQSHTFSLGFNLTWLSSYNYLNLASALLCSFNTTRSFPSLSYTTHKQDTTVVGADLIRLHLHLHVANDDTEDERKFEVN